jgi:signal transduction histidine kinase
MDRRTTSIEADMSGSQTSTQTRLFGRWLVLGRAAWVLLVFLTLIIFAAGLPDFLAQFQHTCAGSTCADGQLTAEAAQALINSGFSLGGYAALRVALAVVWALVFFAVGGVIAWHKFDDWMALLAALMLVQLGTLSVTPTIQQSNSLWQFPSLALSNLGFIPFFLFCLLFPDGRFVPRWTRWMLVWVIPSRVIDTLWPNGLFAMSDSSPLGGLVLLVFMAIAVFAQIYRYRRGASHTQRQQIKWVVFGCVFSSVIFIVGDIVPSLLFPSFIQDSSAPFARLFGSAILLGTTTLIPLSIGFAILRYRLWDIDLIINRTLVYGLLTFLVVGIYVLIVGGLGTVLQVQGNLALSLVATGLIAVLFQPLRLWLQRRINRLLYGQRDEPYAVLSRLGSRLEATLAPDTVLPTIVETVAQALKLPYAAIALQQDQASPITASYGIAGEPLLHLPLLYQSEHVGELLLAPRARGESFTPADRRLLDDLAHQVGIAAHAVRLTADLQLSRERLVRAREEERRRLRRDLHDGLGPTLATITLKAEAAHDAIVAEPAQAMALLEELIGQAQTAITDIRRLVYNLRPPALDDLGLVAAIRAQAIHYEHPGLRVSIEASEPLPELPAAVEVAAYRIIQEALTNVVRHANACSCLIHLAFDGTLRLEVTDDGCGIPADRQAGVGLRSMQERAVEVGGSCLVEALPTRGTRVQASLPCSSDQTHRGPEPA